MLIFEPTLAWNANGAILKPECETSPDMDPEKREVSLDREPRTYGETRNFVNVTVRFSDT